MLCLRGLKRFTKANTDLIPVCIASLCGVCVSSLCYCVGSRAVLRFPPPVQRHAYEVVIGKNKLAECVQVLMVVCLFGRLVRGVTPPWPKHSWDVFHNPP